MKYNKLEHHGFIPDEIKPEDYVFGSSILPSDILQPTGQWDEFLPTDERQNVNGVETYNCTSFGTLNCLEILYKRLFGQSTNLSERYTGICAGTDPYVAKGNSPQTVIQNIRNVGVIDDSLLPFGLDINTVEKYYSPNPMSGDLKSKGETWLSWHKVFHEWVDGDPQSMMDALKVSPLGVGVYAWAFDGEKYVRMGSDTHWTCIYGYEEGKYWKCFDSYDSTHKKLAWNFDFKYVKRYHIDKNLSQQEISIYSKMLSIIAEMLKLISKAYGKLTS